MQLDEEVGKLASATPVMICTFFFSFFSQIFFFFGVRLLILWVYC